MLVRSKLSFILSVAGIIIYPGLNEFSDAIGEKLTNSDYFKEKQKESSLEVIEVDSIDKEKIEEGEQEGHPIVGTIFASSADDAVELIEELFIIGELRLILEKENSRKPKRKKVLDAVNKQIAKLTGDRKEEKKVDNE